MSKVLYDLVSGVPGVRLATKQDEHEIFLLLLMLHKEMGMYGLNEDKVMAGIRWATERQGGIIFCIDEDAHVVASLGMAIACDWYSDDSYLLERWNYVHPDYRRSDYARKLLEQGKWAHAWFKQQGLHMPFQCGINSFDRTEAKVRLYSRIMPCIGAYFMYGEPPVALQAEKYRRAAAEVEEMNRRVRGLPATERRKTVPLVETILRAGGGGNV
jgi:GNAT superfamily N-acetyltransferase